MRSAAVLLSGLLIASSGVLAAARVQRQGVPTPDQSPGPAIEAAGNTPYDGRVVFIRLRYDTGFGGFRSRMGPPWSHDYPRGEMHFMKIIEEITQIRPRTDGSNILSLDDPELFNYPVAYMCEPGYWSMTDKEVEGFRAYLKKGGFVIFDDFRVAEGAWDNLQEQMRR